MFKKIWLHIVRAYLQLGLFFYFKKININGLKHVPKNKAVMLLANHQNALLDALLIAVYTKRFVYFLTRASAFKHNLVDKLLRSVQMLPVYRIRDGWQSLSKNDAIFKTCTNALLKHEVIAIFPEGSHNLKRYVRPLSKGFTRILTATISANKNLDLQLVPIGLNYENALQFQDNVVVNYGKPIAISAYKDLENSKTTALLKNDVQAAIAKLTTHIPKDNYAKNLDVLTVLNTNFLEPIAVNNCIASNFKECNFKPKQKPSLVYKIFKLCLYMLCFLPIVIWRLLIKPKVKELEFLSTFRYTVAITLVPIWILCLCIGMYSFISLQAALLFLVVVFVLLFGLKFG